MKPGNARRPLGPIDELLDPAPPPREAQALLTVQVTGPATAELDAAIDSAIDAEPELVSPPRGEAAQALRGEAPPPPRGEAAPKVPKAKRGSRSGSRKKPYRRDDGVDMIKQQFSAPEPFDELWRLVPALLPRGMDRSQWAVRVLERNIRALAAKKGIQLKTE